MMTLHFFSENDKKGDFFPFFTPRRTSFFLFLPWAGISPRGPDSVLKVTTDEDGRHYKNQRRRRRKMKKRKGENAFAVDRSGKKFQLLQGHHEVPFFFPLTIPGYDN